MKRSPLRRVSPKRAKQLRAYTAIRKSLINGVACKVCHKSPAVDIHHIAGRRGEMLNELINLLPVCRTCHDFIHRHPAKAREAGFLK